MDMMLDIWIAYGNKKLRDVYGEKLKVTEMILNMWLVNSHYIVIVVNHILSIDVYFTCEAISLILWKMPINYND